MKTYLGGNLLSLLGSRASVSNQKVLLPCLKAILSEWLAVMMTYYPDDHWLLLEEYLILATICRCRLFSNFFLMRVLRLPITLN